MGIGVVDIFSVRLNVLSTDRHRLFGIMTMHVGAAADANLGVSLETYPASPYPETVVQRANQRRVGA